MARVIIAAGHTNSNPGIVSGELREVDITRKIAKQVVADLRQKGVITLSLPYELPLERRTAWINSTGYKAATDDIFVEIHTTEGGKSGAQIWHSKNTSKSEDLAKQISDAIKTDTKLEIQSIKDHTQHELGNVAILGEINPLGVLVECLYLDNEKDQEFAKDESKLGQLANAISKGVSKFLGFADKKTFTKPDRISKPIEDSKPVINKPAAPVANIPPVSTPPAFGGNNSFGGGSNFGAPAMSQGFNNDFGGGFNNNAFGANAGGFAGGAATGVGFGANTMGAGQGFGGQGAAKPMSRDERKDMIVKLYKKGFGREPEQADLNYFLNIGITEEQLYKRIMESQDHLDQIENAKKYTDVKTKFDDLQSKYDTLIKQFEDQKNILQKLNILLSQKNSALSQLQKRVQLLTNRIEDIQINRGQQKANINYKSSTLEQIFDYFSKKLA